MAEDDRPAEDVPAAEATERIEDVEPGVLDPPSVIPPPPGAPPPTGVDLEPLRADLALSLELLARVAEGIDRLDQRTEDRLAAVRDAALAPVADLAALLSIRNERTDAQLAELAAAIGGLAQEGPAPVRERLDDLTDAVHDLSARPTADTSGPVLERVDELAGAVQSLTWQLPQLAADLASLREQVERIDIVGPMVEATDELSGRLTLHTDTALAAALQLIDERLTALRKVLADGGGNVSPLASVGGFEAGAVMGAAQATWNRLEQRLDTEFDDLGRQLQGMASLIEQAVASNTAAASRPVVTGDQLRKAASVVKETVVGAGRLRRNRRNGQRGLGTGR